MSFTKRNRVLKRETYKKMRESTILLGPLCNIRTSEDLGPQLLSRLDDKILIDGCDWKGALAIFNYLPPNHRSLHDDDDYYFMMPEKFSGQLLRDNAVFIVLFHHVYNLFLLNEPWTTPPFRSPIKTKYLYLQRVFNSGNYSSALFLEEDLLNAQLHLKQRQYKSWSDFFAVFRESWSKADSTTICKGDDELLAALDLICMNGKAVLTFLKSPIDSETSILMEILPKENTDIEGLCSLILEKIDQHIIYHQTGVKPISTDWIRGLSLYLFS